MMQKWFHTVHSSPVSSQGVFCFPWIGGSNTSFSALAPYLTTTSLYGAALPGRGISFSIPPEKDLKRLIYAFADAMQKNAVNDYVFWGHSMGGMMAFELIRELRRRSWPLPHALIVSGARAPHLVVHKRESLVYKLPDAEFIDHVYSLGGMPEELLNYPEFIQLMLPALRADFYIHENYDYEDELPLAIPIIALGGKDDTIVSQSDIEAWGIHTAAKFESQMFEGGHFFIRQYWPKIATVLENVFDNAVY